MTNNTRRELIEQLEDLRGQVSEIERQLHGPHVDVANIAASSADNLPPIHQRLLNKACTATESSCWELDLRNDQLIVQTPEKDWLGFSASEIPANASWWEDRVHPEDRETRQRAIDAHIEGRTDAYEVECRVAGKTGEWYWILDRGSVVQRGDDGKPVRVGGVATDITKQKRDELLLFGEKRILEAISTDRSRDGGLSELVDFVAANSTTSICSILLLDESKTKLHLGAARQLPDEYNEAIEGLEIGPNVGSCGTAAFLNETVIVSDVLSDQRWEDFRELAAAHGLRACWAVPIPAPDGTVVGTFAVYGTEPRSPTDEDLRVLERAVHLASIALEKLRATDALRLRDR